MNSMFTVTGKVVKTFVQQPAFDKVKQEMPKPVPKIQLLGEMPVQGGDSRFDLITLGVEDLSEYVKLVNHEVRVPLGIFANEKQGIVYFIPKGSKPELVAQA